MIYYKMIPNLLLFNYYKNYYKYNINSNKKIDYINKKIDNTQLIKNISNYNFELFCLFI